MRSPLANICARIALLEAVCIPACGTDRSNLGDASADVTNAGANVVDASADVPPSNQDCAPGEVSCPACGGGSICMPACLPLRCSGSDAGSSDAAPTGDAGAQESGTCSVSTCPMVDAQSDVRMQPDAADAGGVDAAPLGLIRCGSSWCDALTQDCCFHADWSEYCGPKSSSCGLSCSSPASCPPSQICCATQTMAGSVTASCSSTPCTAGPGGGYQLCASEADCPGGQPCAYHLIPASDPGPIACAKCAAVSCTNPMQCCPASGSCYNPGCGSCCY
jgi:hypothetical protein